MAEPTEAVTLGGFKRGPHSESGVGQNSLQQRERRSEAGWNAVLNPAFRLGARNLVAVTRCARQSRYLH